MTSVLLQVTSQCDKLGCKTEATSGILLAGSRTGLLNLYGQTSDSPFSDQLPSGKVTAAELFVSGLSPKSEVEKLTSTLNKLKEK